MPRVFAGGHLGGKQLVPLLPTRRVAEVVAAVVLDVRRDALPGYLGRAEVADAGGEQADGFFEEAELGPCQLYVITDGWCVMLA